MWVSVMSSRSTPTLTITADENESRRAASRTASGTPAIRGTSSVSGRLLTSDGVGDLARRPAGPAGATGSTPATSASSRTSGIDPNGARYASKPPSSG